jgi:hypothetical protein
MQDAIAFFKEGLADFGSGSRLYTNVFGDNDILAAELEFDDIEAAARFVAEIEGDESQSDITARGWYDISAGNVVELWKIVD